MHHWWVICPFFKEESYKRVLILKYKWLPCSSGGKESACNAGDLGLIPGSRRPRGEGNGNPLQYSCWRIPWTGELGGLQEVAKSWTRLSSGLSTARGLMYISVLSLITLDRTQYKANRRHHVLYSEFHSFIIKCADCCRFLKFYAVLHIKTFSHICSHATLLFMMLHRFIFWYQVFLNVS